MISTEIHKSGYNLDAVLCSVAQSCQALCDPMDYSPPGSSVHGNSPGKNTGVGCHALLQWIFPSQGIKPKCPALEADSFCLSHQGSPRILECLAYPFSRGSSWPRSRIGFSCIAGGFFTSWATREAIYEKPKTYRSWTIGFKVSANYPKNSNCFSCLTSLGIGSFYRMLEVVLSPPSHTPTYWEMIHFVVQMSKQSNSSAIGNSKEAGGTS